MLQIYISYLHTNYILILLSVISYIVFFFFWVDFFIQHKPKKDDFNNLVPEMIIYVTTYGHD